MSVIYGERIRLRAPERTDIPAFLKWFNDPEVTPGLFSVLPMSLAEEENWYETMIKQPPEQHPLSIEVQEGKTWKLIGNTGFIHIDQISRNAEIGILIGEKEYWNQGYGTEAMQLMLKHGFDTLNLHRIELRVYAFNERAARSYEKAGFIHEGRMRQAVYRQGKYYDVLFMGVLRDEWRANNKKK